jgi:hypothetical protein
VTMLSSHAGDSTTEMTWSRHDVDTESCMLATMKSSHASDGVAEATWL